MLAHSLPLQSISMEKSRQQGREAVGHIESELKKQLMNTGA